MNRLIDAEELINERPENLNPDMNDEIKSAYNKGWNSCNSEWISTIKEQPIAYDIDKVIGQLEKVSFVDVDEEYADDGQRMLFLHDAIEIVKRGGSEWVKQ